jgi:hypothetical protein
MGTYAVVVFWIAKCRRMAKAVTASAQLFESAKATIILGVDLQRVR